MEEAPPCINDIVIANCIVHFFFLINEMNARTISKKIKIRETLQIIFSSLNQHLNRGLNQHLLK